MGLARPLSRAAGVESLAVFGWRAS